ncbi:hypothetical protein Tco_0168992 [Tanacetum coccineum]
MNYEPVTARNQTNSDAGIETNIYAGQAGQEKASDHELHIYHSCFLISPLSFKVLRALIHKDANGRYQEKGNVIRKTKGFNKEETSMCKISELNWILCLFNRKKVMITTLTVLLILIIISYAEQGFVMRMFKKEATGIFDDAYDDREEVGVEADLNNLETTMNVGSIPTTRIHKDHPIEQIIGDLHLAPQTRRISMIGSLMYLIASRPDIMFVVCACVRFQVTPKVLHLNAVKKIFRYLKGQPKLGLWYPRDSPFDLEACSESDYAGASLDRKSTTGGCQFLGKRLISWQCKKQNIVANSTTEAEYVAAANCCGQVLWIQNQMLDYGFNFMNTKIHIDNESTICIVKNLVFHSKTKHIEIRHHFIRDSYEKKLIQVIKIYTDHNIVDLLSKAFDVSSDEFGVKTGSCKVYAARQDLMLLDKNAEFYQIVDFITTSSILYALTVCPIIYASYIEHFWATAKSKIVNDVKQIHAKVDGKTVVISESSVRSDLHFNDEDGIACLSNDCDKTERVNCTLENGDMEITATIDGKVKVVSEASIRRHLKLEDSDGISTLPTLEIFEQLALMGSWSKSSKARRRVRLVVSEDEDKLEDPFKQGRKIAQIDEDEGITLVQMSAQTQGRHEHDFEEFDFEFIALEEDYTAKPDISTANVPVSTADAEVILTQPLKLKNCY